MRLKDKLDTTVAIPPQKVSVKQIRVAVNSKFAYEDMFDVLAQASGPNMLQNINGPSTLDPAPMADPGDVTDISDVWPEQDIIRQTQDMRNQGIPDQTIYRQLIEMGALGSPTPMAQDMEYLDGVMKQAQKDDDPRDLDDPNLDTYLRPLDEMQRPPAPGKKLPVLDKNLPQPEKDSTVASFLRYVKTVHDKWTMLHELLMDSRGHGKAEKKYLQNKLADIQIQISKLGSAWKRLLKVYGKDVLKNEEVMLLQEMLGGKPSKTQDPGGQLNKVLTEGEPVAPAEPEKKASPGEGPAGTAASPMNGQRDPLSKEEVRSTGKIGQRMPARDFNKMVRKQDPRSMGAPPPAQPATKPSVADDIRDLETLPPKELPSQTEQESRAEQFKEFTPPGKFGSESKQAQGAPPPAAPPAGGPPPAPGGEDEMAPGGEETDMPPEDMRSLEEVMADLADDVAAMQEKLDAGETMLHGQDVVPVDSDAGPMPAGPPKIAVDQPAKKYYEGYFGEYGKDLSEDKVAGIVDLIDETATVYKTTLTGKQAGDVARFVASRHVDALNPALDWVEDKILVNYLFKTGMVHGELAPQAAQAVWQMAAVNIGPDLRATLARVAAEGKMKSPKVKGQSDDAVKLDKMKDNADEAESFFRPAHLPMQVVDKRRDGMYMRLTIEWDPDHASADRSDAGMEQAVRSFMKGLESQKEFLDYGFLGQITVDELDLEAGMAEIHFRTKKMDGPLTTREDK